MDAIRWVLGEQKISNLRSEKLENIVFNGTKKRKATQLAEVSLSFNNTKNLLPVEYNQVTITRRFYRSGDSEYLLNGVNCRLKDITNLFLDTGIASNSYAIIELGMVDDILNDKENSRRALFEEAAGISKFKVRKKETLRKLKDTDADLERVEDLLYEIEKNMRSLERQAKQTERYFKVKEEYKLLSVEMARKSVARQQQSLQNINKQLEQENDQKTSVNKQIAEHEAQLAQLKTDLVSKEKLLGSRQKSLNEHVAKIRHYESEKKIKHERLKYLNDKSDTLREQLEQDKQSNQRAQFSIKSLEQEQTSAKRMLAEAEERLKQLKDDLQEQKLKTEALQNEFGTLDKIHGNEKDELYQIKKEMEIKQVQISSYKQQLEKTTSETSEKSASLVEFEQKINALNEALNEKNTQLKTLLDFEAKNKNRLESTAKTIEMIKEERGQVNRKIDAKQNEYNLTKSLVDNLEGFPEAIKYLKKKANWNKKAPLLSDIISCEDKYRITIENYLEPFMNYYVVDDEAEAYQAINILSDAAKGKAHFFVLNKFEKYQSSHPKIYDNAIPATEIIEYDSKYRKLIAHILDGVYIVSGSETNIPADVDNIFITQNGKITRRRYSISGGSVGLFEGKRIGRAKNVEKLQGEIKTLQAKLDEIDQNLREAQGELESLKGKTKGGLIEQQQKEINQLNNELVSFQTRQEQVAGLLSGNTTKREDILEQIGQMNEELEKLGPQAEKIESDLETNSLKLQNISEELAGNKELLDIKSTGYNEENIRFHQQQNKLTSLEQEINFKQNAFDNSKERIEKNQGELQKNEDEIRKLLESNEIDEDELVAKYVEKEQIEKGVNEAEREYYTARGEIDKAETAIRDFHKKRETIDNLLIELQDKRNELKLEMSSVKERLSVEFDVDIDNLPEASDDTLEAMSPEDLAEQVNQTKDKLDKIGPINPMAMEAYNEIKERHEFITGQKHDLLQARESLMTTMDEIDLVARETFLTAYAKIKENFIKVFRSLFTDEDDCDLKLLDPGNPLESSIEIIAKPKGKKPLTISQLSGGEKTLTATSLLFAIYLLKPAPFCIFDEVDAPLDDANIDKFNYIIRKFSEESQFIIVTHNKRTMASTDVIYGITMIEQGVSRVVPVDLRDLE